MSNAMPPDIYTPLTPYYNAVPMNISGPGADDPGDLTRPQNGNIHPVSIRTLIPNQPSTTKVFVHYMPWFEKGTSPDYSLPDSNPREQNYVHTPTGYVSNNAAVVDEQLRDIKARGFDGLVIDWNGKQDKCRNPAHAFDPFAGYVVNFPTACPTDRATTNTATNLVAQKVLAKGDLEFALMIDQQSFKDSCTFVQDGGLQEIDQPACVQQRLLQELQNLKDNPNYLPNPKHYQAFVPALAQTRKVLFTFIAEADWFGACNFVTCALLNNTPCISQKACWEAIWDSVAAFANTFPQSPVDLRPVFVFQDHGEHQGIKLGAQHQQSAGMYAWVKPNDATGYAITSDTQEDWGETRYLNSWYQEAADYGSKLRVAAVYKGFDKYRAFANPKIVSNGQNGMGAKVMTQECGQVWLKTWNKIQQSNLILDMVQVATWNDYDEGTAIEPGIENCVGVHSPNVTWDPYGTYMDLTWTIEGLEEAIDHFEVYASKYNDDDENLTLLGDYIPSNVRTFNLMPHAKLPGEWWVYVKAIGKAGMTNKISFAALWCGSPGLSTCRPSRPPRHPPVEQSNYMAAAPASDALPPQEPEEPPLEDPPPDCENPDPNNFPLECGNPT